MQCAQLCSHLSLHPIPNFAPTPTPTHNPPRFYQYTITKPLDVKLPGEEAIHGMTLTSPYASTASPDAAWWDNMTSFLDGAAAAGFRVNFQLIGFEQKGNDAGTLANLTAQIERFKDHPAIMAWCVLVLLWWRGGEGEEAERRSTVVQKYSSIVRCSSVQVCSSSIPPPRYLADEPGGQGIKNTTLLPKYNAIRAADPDGHPVTMVFCTTQAANYLEMLDIIMVDPYPIPGASAASVASALDNVASLGKPVMMVPQAFGGGENWSRGPSRQEERLMTYLGLLTGAKAIQYFVRSPEGVL